MIWLKPYWHLILVLGICVLLIIGGLFAGILLGHHSTPKVHVHKPVAHTAPHHPIAKPAPTPAPVPPPAPMAPAPAPAPPAPAPSALSLSCQELHSPGQVAGPVISSSTRRTTMRMARLVSACQRARARI